MKRTLLPLGIILMVVTLVVAAHAGPRLTLPESWFNFGYVPQGATVTHTFWLKSTGDEELRVLKVIPGCGCTKAPLEKDIIPVGDSAELNIYFSTSRFKNRVTKRPRIRTNAGPPDKRLQIIANVVGKDDSTKPLMFDPARAVIWQSFEKAPREMEVAITNVSDEELNLTLLADNERYFDLQLPETIGPGETKNAHITFKEEVLRNKFDASFTVQVDDEWSHRFTFPVNRSQPKPQSATAGKGIKGR